jgi:putative nucleotidyltransferase with HDIG domain
MSLLLLTDNHPLLERLKREAPGTFFHSMMVATLAEDAAKAIGGNAIRAKCGALYHDIGKLSKPQYFTENNLENNNQHTDLNPQVSSIIIRDHVNEGLALARKYKLNRVIRNAIEQHHGNDLVHYFYNRAINTENKNGSHFDEGQFRYQGELPREKEMVIISLADACEAAVRSLEKPSVQKIEIMVDEIFKKRFRDNQLNHAQMTLDELHKVRESFVTNLISMRHGRISYHKDENGGNEDENDLFMAAAKEHSQSEPQKTEEIY